MLVYIRGVARQKVGEAVSRLPRAERREQILAAATEVFARSGFAATGLDDVAQAAGVSRAILYRHFESKTDLYRAALDRAREHLNDAVGKAPYSERIIDDLVAAAGRDPAGFRLLFHQAAREPDFRSDTDQFNSVMVAMAHQQLAPSIPDPAWAQWAAHMAPTVAITAITSWLDAGQPDPGLAANAIRHVLRSVTEAAHHTTAQVCR